MKDVRLWILVMIGLFFYLFHYTIDFLIYALGFELYDSYDYILYNTIWYALCIAIEVLLLRLYKLSVRKMGKPFLYLLAFCIFANFMYLPDRIDFVVSRKLLEEKRINKNIDKIDYVLTLSCYTTKAPNRMPLIADNRSFAYGTPELIATYSKLNPESCFIKMDNTGWYILYRENKYQDG